MDKWVVYIIVHNNLQVIVNSIHSSFFFKYLFSLIWGVYLRMEFLGHIQILWLTFWEIVFSTAATWFYMTTNNICVPISP